MLFSPNSCVTLGPPAETSGPASERGGRQFEDLGLGGGASLPLPLHWSGWVTWSDLAARDLGNVV